MKILSYILGSSEEKIIINGEYYFGQLWNGDGNGEELLESGAISPDGENIVAFEVVKKANDILETIVRVTDMY